MSQALFSDEEGQVVASEPRRVELNKEARDEIVQEISREKPAYMRKSGNLGGERIGAKEKPVKSSGRRIRKNRFAASSLPALKTTSKSAVMTASNHRSLASRRANEDELSMLFESGMKDKE